VKCVSTFRNVWDGAFVIVLKASPSIDTRSLAAYESGQLTETMIQAVASQAEIFRPTESSVAPQRPQDWFSKDIIRVNNVKPEHAHS
jgi:hypothetical protein